MQKGRNHDLLSSPSVLVLDFYIDKISPPQADDKIEYELELLYIVFPSLPHLYDLAIYSEEVVF